MIAWLLIFNILYGFIAHGSHGYIVQKFGNGWRDMVKHTAGILMAAPIFAALEWLTTKDPKRVMELMIKYFFIFGTFGLGNSLAWVLLGGESEHGER